MIWERSPNSSTMQSTGLGTFRFQWTPSASHQHTCIAWSKYSLRFGGPSDLQGQTISSTNTLLNLYQRFQQCLPRQFLQKCLLYIQAGPNPSLVSAHAGVHGECQLKAQSKLLKIQMSSVPSALSRPAPALQLDLKSLCGCSRSPRGCRHAAVECLHLVLTLPPLLLPEHDLLRSAPAQ